MNSEEQRAVDYLRKPRAIRERCGAIYAAGLAGNLAHFTIDETKYDAIADLVLAVTEKNYPAGDIPYHSRWNHFRAGGVERVSWLEETWGELDKHDRARSQIDLVVTSVLLDAGAGPDWSFFESDSGDRFTRSEGLAVASFHMFRQGKFSASGHDLSADGAALLAMSAEKIAQAFQVAAGNDLVGLQGRAALLQKLGLAVSNADWFGGRNRVGGLYDGLAASAERHDGKLPATEILRAVLLGLGPIWPGRIAIGSENLGDVWRHSHAGGEGLSARLVPFHKLSQWLTYSLIEIFEQVGIAVTNIDDLTGLPEYRNGGLLVDMGLLHPKSLELTQIPQLPSSEPIVEWRALTVIALDKIADKVRTKLGKTADELPLARVLEGGTWAAGRQLASQKRGGLPPISIDSDGTVF